MITLVFSRYHVYHCSLLSYHANLHSCIKNYVQLRDKVITNNCNNLAKKEILILAWLCWMINISWIAKVMNPVYLLYLQCGKDTFLKVLGFFKQRKLTFWFLGNPNWIKWVIKPWSHWTCWNNMNTCFLLVLWSQFECCAVFHEALVSVIVPIWSALITFSPHGSRNDLLWIKVES